MRIAQFMSALNVQKAELKTITFNFPSPRDLDTSSAGKLTQSYYR